MRWVSRRPRIVLCVIPRWMDSKRDNSGRWFVKDSSPMGGRLRPSPLLSNNVRVYASTRLRQVNLVNAEVIPQGSTSPQQAQLTKDKKISDTTSMVKKTERDKGPPQPLQNVMTQIDPQQRRPFSRLWSRISGLPIRSRQKKPGNPKT